MASLHARPPPPANMSRYTFSLVPTTLIVFGLAMWWLHSVNSVITEAYLDEVFHVRQAQAYWQHRWRQWDPKITTPPGLYLASYLVGTLAYSIFRYPLQPYASDMRYVNGLVLLNLFPLPLRRLLNSFWGTTASGVSSMGTALPTAGICEWELNLTVMNICLFPPVFFFSGLYYTDLAALLIVMQVYAHDLQRHSEGAQVSKQAQEASTRVLISWQSLIFLIYGTIALLFRQTNIFWVVVFVGGFRVVRTLRSITVDCKGTDAVSIARSSWELHQLFDPPVNQACFEDYLKASTSLAIAALANLHTVIVELVPYFVVLGAFALFVLWNGGVVLGHKEFHAASLHLPQMLYIWPYFIFFSWPVILFPWLVSLWVCFQSKSLGTRLIGIFPRIGLTLCFTALMLVIVHLNTIVHPFTLADNRHYVFYIFRILLRHPAIKYAAAPIYFICAWLVLGAFGPSIPHTSSTPVPHSSQTPSRHLSSSGTTSKAKSLDDSNSAATVQKPGSGTQREGVRVSFVIVWFVSTALSLITAPLVEPRYFIIPWVIWRLHVPPASIWLRGLPSPSATSERGSTAKNAGTCHGVSSSPIARYLPLVVEFVWYMIINGVTGFVFLYKGFEWPQEPGQVQRFLW